MDFAAFIFYICFVKVIGLSDDRFKLTSFHPPANVNATGADTWVVTIAIKSKPTLCLDLTGGQTQNGNTVEIWECNGSDNQLWYFAAGSGKIQYGGDPSKCLDAGADMRKGNVLMIWDCNEQAQQRWGYDSNENTVYLASSASSDASLCMDLSGASVTHGTPVQVWDCSASWNQQWGIQLGKNTYSEDEARKFVTLSALTYCEDTTHLSDWSCEGCSQSNTPLVSSKIRIIDVGVKNATRILVGKLRDQAGCLMVFRGSANDFNWKRDYEITQVVPEDYEDCPGCKVHSGFYTIWKNVRGEALQALRDVGCGPVPSCKSANCDNPDNLLYVTGHSMGAALTELAMFTLQNHGFNVAKTYTFESPRVGNKAFADAFALNFKRKFDIFRITHAQDPFIHVPPTLFGYEHVQTEVFYDRKGNYKVCVGNEDPDCSDQYWNIPGMLRNHEDDHCMMPFVEFQNICWPSNYGLCDRHQDTREVMV